MENVLKGTIKIESPGVKETFQQVATGVSKMGDSIKSSISPLNQTEQKTRSYKSTLSTVPRASNDVSSSSQRMASSTAAAGAAVQKTTGNFTGLTRVIQDLPFGFIAISNNLEQLLPAAGGLGLAFSGVVSALTFAQVGFSNWVRGSGDVDKASDKTKQKLQETKDRIAELTRAFSEIKNGVTGTVAGDTDAEIIKIQTLTKVVTDVSKSYTERNKALNQLKEINKNYFGDLTLESDKLSTLTSRVDQYTKALVAASVVKAFSDEIGKVGKELAEQDAKLGELRSSLNAIAGDYQLVGQKVKGFRLLTPQQNQDAEKLRSQVKDQETIVSALGNTYKKLQKQVESAVLETLKFKPLETTGDDKKKPKTDDLKKMLEERKQIILEFLEQNGESFKIPVERFDFDVKGKLNNDELKQSLQNQLNRLQFLNLEVKIPTTIQAIDPKNVPIPLKPTVTWQPTELQAQMADINGQISAMINQFVQNISVEGLSTIGEAIGAALTGNDIGNVFQQFEQVLGSAVEALGKKIITLNVAALAVKKSLKVTFDNPYSGIVAGIALVAIGAALKNIASGGIKGFAKGGFVPGSGNGDTVPAMLTPGEFVVTKDKAGLAAALFGKGSGISGGGIQRFSLGGTVAPISIPSLSTIGVNQFSNVSNILSQSRTPVDVNVKVEGQISNDVILLSHTRALRANDIDF